MLVERVISNRQLSGLQRTGYVAEVLKGDGLQSVANALWKMGNPRRRSIRARRNMPLG